MGQYGSFLYLLVFVGIMYFIMIRPQQKQNKIRQQMLSNLEKGDRIVTAGGIHGKITSLKEDTINLEIAPNVVITLQKSGVGVVKDEEEERPTKKAQSKKALKSGTPESEGSSVEEDFEAEAEKSE